MGNESSSVDISNRKSNPDIPLLNTALTASYLNLNDNLSYKGMKTETSLSDISDKTTERTLEQEDSNSFSFDFEWKEGGNRVLLTGSFVNWTQYFEMAYEDESGRFHFLLTLPKQSYQFKFIVDNQWKCSKYYEIKDDGNYNLNNFIDLALISSNNNNNNNNNDIKNHSGNQIIQVQNQDDEYNCFNPDIKEMNADAPLIPYSYKKTFKLNRNTNQDKIGKKRFINSSSGIAVGNGVGENNCYRKIYNTPHVNVNHILLGVCDNVERSHVIKSGIAVKCRQKVVTVVYYTPN